jgi:hypothetical protein
VKEYRITSGFLDRQRRLILAEDYLEWENKDLKGEEFTRLNKADVADFKHGMDWVVWYKITVGRQFSITFKDTKNRELKILFDSYFGLHKENNQLYSDIVDDIWKFYHSDIVDAYLDKFYNKGELEIRGIKINNIGIQLTGQNSILSWDKVDIKEYYSYFAVYHRDNPDVHSRVSYNKYGTETLWSTLRTILKEKGMNASQHSL